MVLQPLYSKVSMIFGYQDEVGLDLSLVLIFHFLFVVFSLSVLFYFSWLERPPIEEMVPFLDLGFWGVPFFL